MEQFDVIYFDYDTVKNNINLFMEIKEKSPVILFVDVRSKWEKIFYWITISRLNIKKTFYLYSKDKSFSEQIYNIIIQYDYKNICFCSDNTEILFKFNISESITVCNFNALYKLMNREKL